MSLVFIDLGNRRLFNEYKLNPLRIMRQDLHKIIIAIALHKIVTTLNIEPIKCMWKDVIGEFTNGQYWNEPSVNSSSIYGRLMG